MSAAASATEAMWLTPRTIAMSKAAMQTAAARTADRRRTHSLLTDCLGFASATVQHHHNDDARPRRCEASCVVVCDGDDDDVIASTTSMSQGQNTSSYFAGQHCTQTNLQSRTYTVFAISSHPSVPLRRLCDLYLLASRSSLSVCQGGRQLLCANQEIYTVLHSCTI